MTKTFHMMEGTTFTHEKNGFTLIFLIICVSTFNAADIFTILINFQKLKQNESLITTRVNRTLDW